MPILVDSGSEVDSEEERRERKKAKHRSKSRSRSRDKKKSKKHKKEKKHKRRRSNSGAGDTEGEDGAATPTRTEREDTPASIEDKLPGLGKYDSDDGSEDDRAKKKRERYDRDKDRDREKRSERKRRKRSRSRSRSRHKRSRSKERRKEGRRGEYRREEGEIEAPPPDIDLTQGGSKEVISLSIEETNKLRASLGLKPLNITDKNKAEDEEGEENLEGTLIPGDRDKTRHLPPQHIGQVKKSEKLREKLATKKEKRSIQSKLAAVRGLADSDSDDDAETWIQRQKSKVDAKAEAEKRAKMMSELDDEFGVGEIVTDKIKQDKGKQYSSRDLKGLRVEHSTEHFEDVGETILTLKDSDILDEKYEDVLVNVNIMDTERTKKNFENIKSQAGYQAYDNEVVDDLTGMVKKKDLLYQYTEEIDGIKKQSFKLAESGEFNAEEDKARELAKIRHKLKLGAAQSLEMPELRLASDYYNEEEMASFKKPKSKKKKIRKKMLKADDLLAMQTPESLLPADFGSVSKKKRAARIIDDDEERLPGDAPNYDDLPVVQDLSGHRFEDDDVSAVKKRLLKAKKLKLKKAISSLDSVADGILAEQNDVEMQSSDLPPEYDDLVLDQTQEFCRGLGDNKTYTVSGMEVDVDPDLLDFERSLTSSDKKKSQGGSKSSGKMKSGGWEVVGDPSTETAQIDENDDDEFDGNKSKRVARPAILDAELMAGQGMGAALKIASQMGYIEREQTRTKDTALQDLKAQKYSVEDKSRDYEEDDRKRRGRDRGSYAGPTTSFTEKKGYKPEVTLEYVDDSGREMSQKEAFRYLSHKFHGKGSGKIKTEKRQRKIAEDKVMERMSSTDTPLNTLQKQLNRSKDLATPYLVLTGNRQLNSLKK